MSTELKVNTQHCTDKVRADYAHIGLFDVQDRRLWAARQVVRPPSSHAVAAEAGDAESIDDLPDAGLEALRMNHAHLLLAGSRETSTPDKDRFVCYWFHTPGTGAGYLQGYPIEWEEGHLLVRLDPNWNYLSRRYIPPTDTARIEKNIDQQFAWGRKIFETYVGKRPPFALSWHMLGPRASDSMFYIQRVEAGG